jgi:hypothetical protein
MSDGTKAIFTPFYDLKERSNGKSGFFFLENILKARAALHLESGTYECDQELNVYIAGLLNSLLHSDSFLRQKPYISPFDTDVRQWLVAHPGLRMAYTVYRENADVGLLFSGLFSGQHHDGSYHRIVIGEEEQPGRIALYYELAASALAHLQGSTVSLVDVFETIAEHVEEILRILHRAADDYFNLGERISAGSFFHLERELDAMDAKKRYEQELDEFLKLYGAYREQPCEATREKLITLAEKLRKLNGDFRFEGV